MKKALLLASLLAGFAAPVAAQVGTVEGRVIDARTGETIPGANVVVEGTTIGASTDVDGEFSFDAPAGTYRLLASFVGYLPASEQVVVVEGQTRRVEVALEEDLLGLDEVFVVGFGTTSELALTGSVARVGEREIDDAVVNSFEQVLQGRAAGVTVQANNGKLGQGLEIRVRGAASVTAGNGPLYVVDGIPVTTENLSVERRGHEPARPAQPERHRVHRGPQGRLGVGHLRLARLERRRPHYDQERLRRPDPVLRRRPPEREPGDQPGRPPERAGVHDAPPRGRRELGPPRPQLRLRRRR